MAQMSTHVLYVWFPVIKTCRSPFIHQQNKEKLKYSVKKNETKHCLKKINKINIPFNLKKKFF